MKKAYKAATIVITIILALDQLTKYIVATLMELGQNIVVIDGFFTISSHRNDGAAWGIFSGNMVFFYIITVFAIGLFYILLKDVDFKKKPFYSYAISLMTAGGLGNFIDRILFQEVVDFINIDIFSYTTFPIFNIADIALVVGMILFAADVLFEEVLHGKNSSRQEE